MASRWTTDRRIKTGFALAFGAPVGECPWSSYWNREKLSESNQWVAHTYEVIATLEATMRSLADAETIERGYVITGREGYVASEEATCFAAKNLLAQAAAADGDNPRSSVASRRSSRSCSAKVDFMEQVVATRPHRRVR
jgi:CHASE3 domain sensor protein